MSEYREIVDKKRDAMLDTLLECIENNPAPWQKGWVSVYGGLTSSGYPYNAKTGKPYNGINALYLAVIEGRRGYGDARWATFSQIQELGASVRKGEKGSDIFFWTQYDKATKKPFDRKSVEGLTEEELKEYLNKTMLNYLVCANDLNSLQQNLKALLSQAWPVIIGVVSAVVVIWGLFIGFKWWQAGTQEKQREAKDYLKNFFIGLICIFVVGVVAVALIGWLGEWAGGAGGLTA